MTLLYRGGDLHILIKHRIMIILHFHLFVHMHHTGSQENEVEPEEPEETSVQGLSEGQEPEGERATGVPRPQA